MSWSNYWKKYSPADYRTIAFFVVIVVAAATFIMYYQYKPAAETGGEGQPLPKETVTEPKVTAEVETSPPAVKGNLIVALKDVQQKLMGLGTATELLITVKSVQVHTSDNVTENRSVIASGWMTVFEGEKTFDLLKYTSNIALIAEKKLEVGTYTQIRLYVSDASIKIYNTDVPIYNKTYPMVIPSNAIKVVRPFSVVADKTLVLTLDFDVPQSVTRTGEGYTLKPTIKIIEQTLEKDKRPENAVVV